MSLEILKPGLLTTVQDRGRYGYQREGIMVGGAMDTFALRVANLLVGNAQNQASLEITLAGPTIRFSQDHLIALTGADLSPTLDGEPLKQWRTLYVKEGSTLAFGEPKSGCRTYLAVSGGFAIPAVMGSYSTSLRAGIGGLEGRALKAGDRIPCTGITPTGIALLREPATTFSNGTYTYTNWTPDPQLYPNYHPNPTLRAIRGAEYELFSESSKALIWSERFQVSPQSDRMGYRLQGVTISLAEHSDLISSAVTFGTVQVPPEGQPIVLMADHQTTGGYPRIAQVISADLPILAQVVPGQTIDLVEVTLEEAQQLYVRQEQHIAQLERAIQLKNHL
ncbi:5-oxoprolinase subunit C family protein [Pontibacter roseus]|uniref:5-oxoprolinase subunit C family protein n=1 Tax=Pontibacter roseus TaxID=336989 RepID=UPI00035C1BEC|nr:biotin-dependent carboxyltransferase family protein [Pontibacter roseus]